MRILFKLKILNHYINSKIDEIILNEKNKEKFQNKKIKKHLKFIIKKSKYFNKLVKSKNPNLEEFPIINKTIMMENFNEFCTVDIDKEKAFELAIDSEKKREFKKDYGSITVALSSGTSGNRGLAVANEYDKTLWTGRMLSKLMPRTLFAKERIAFFLRANNNVYESLKSSRISFKYFDLMKENEENILELEKYNPTVITAPASMLLLIAKAVENKKIKINPIKIISVAEVLYDSDKKYLEKIFKQIIHQIYQATEGFLGYTCKYGTIHINEDMIKIEKEYIDKNTGRFIPIITDFKRRTQPIIRYRLNDILLEKKDKCKCGSCFLAIEKIEGREDDIFYFEGEKKDIAVFSDFISRAIIYASDEIIEYYANQSKKNEINIYLEIKNELNKNIIEKEIIKNLYELKEKKGIKIIDVNFTDKYYREKGKKMKRIERTYNYEV